MWRAGWGANPTISKPDSMPGGLGLMSRHPASVGLRWPPKRLAAARPRGGAPAAPAASGRGTGAGGGGSVRHVRGDATLGMAFPMPGRVNENIFLKPNCLESPDGRAAHSNQSPRRGRRPRHPPGQGADGRAARLCRQSAHSAARRLAMTLTELKYTVAVAREKHFGHAADAGHVSQPTLSVAIKKLEEELDLKLFERSASEVTVTPLGALIVRQAQSVLEQAAAIKEIAKRGKDPLA